MKSYRSLFLLIAAVSLGLVGFALYLQHQLGWAPCPWCVIQRYLFILLALVCLVFAFLSPRAARAGSGLGALVALAGAGSAGWHVYTKANPTVSCGIDPLETALNRIPPAEMLPFLFRADGLCSTPYPPILGLDTPQWSLVWFSVFALILLWATFRPSR